MNWVTKQTKNRRMQKNKRRKGTGRTNNRPGSRAGTVLLLRRRKGDR